MIRALVKRLGRPHPSGGTVIERAAILAEGADFASVMAWIVDHDGHPEPDPKTNVAAVSTSGLHGSRQDRMGAEPGRPPHRYVLPAGVLT